MIDKLEAYLAHPNIIAGLHVIAAGETHESDELAYRALFGWHWKRNRGRVFDSFSDHPRIRTYETHDEFIRDGDNADFTTAAGRYQATATTWDDFIRATGPRDFSPHSQDLFALWCIQRRGALEDLASGRVELFLTKCRKEWASLPGAGYGQPEQPLKQALATYAKWGGQPPAEQAKQPDYSMPPDFNPDSLETEHYGEEPTMDPITISLAAGLAGKLIDLFSPLAREKLTKTLERHTDDPNVASQIAGTVIEAAKSVTGKLDEVSAVAAVRENPGLVAKVEERALENLAKLAPVLDKVAELERGAWDAEERSRDSAAARARAEANDLAPMLANWAVKGLVGMIVILAALIAAQIYFSPDHKPMGELVTALTGMMMLFAGKSNTVYDYRFGSSRSSGAKDIVISELSRK